MAIFDFTGANGDPLPAAFTTIEGAWEIQNNRADSQGADPTGPRWFAVMESKADGAFSAVVNLGGSLGSGVGIVVRYVGPENFLTLLVNRSNSALQLYHRNNGWTLLQSWTIPSFDATLDYDIGIVTAGDQLTASLGGVDRFTVTSTINQTATMAGMRSGASTESIDSLTLEDATVQTVDIIIDEPTYTNQVYQCGTDGNRTVTFGVQFTSAPTALEYRVMRDGVEFQTWQVFDDNPTGGVSAVTVTVPGSTLPYSIQVRDGLGSSDSQGVAWYAGEIIVVVGQSLALQMGTVGSITAPQGMFEFDAGAGKVPTVGSGHRALARLPIDAYGRACLIVNSAVGSTALTEESGEAIWWANRAGSYYQGMLNDIDAATGGENAISLVYWHQGDKDSKANVSTYDYMKINASGGLTSLIKNMRDDFSSPMGVLRIYASTLQRDTRAGQTTDVQHQQIRDALVGMCNADEFFFHLPVFTMETPDGTHGSSASYADNGLMCGAMEIGQRNGSPVGGPRVIAADVIAEGVELTFDRDIGGTTYDTEGVRVELNGSAITLTGFTKTATRKAVIATGADLSTGSLKVFIGYGKGTTTAGLSYPIWVQPAGPGSFPAVNIPAESASLPLVRL